MNILIEKGNNALYDWFCADVEELKQFLKNAFDIEILKRGDIEKAYFNSLKESIIYARDNNLCAIDFLSAEQPSIKDFLILNYGLSCLLENEIIGFFNDEKVIFYNFKKNGEPQAVFVDLKDEVDVENALYSLLGCDFKVHID